MVAEARTVRLMLLLNPRHTRRLVAPQGRYWRAAAFGKLAIDVPLRTAGFGAGASASKRGASTVPSKEKLSGEALASVGAAGGKMGMILKSRAREKSTRP